MSNQPPWIPQQQPPWGLQDQTPLGGQQWLPQEPSQRAPWDAPWQPAGPQEVTKKIPAAPGRHPKPSRRSHNKRNIILAAIGALLVIGTIGDVLGTGKTHPPKPAAATTPATNVATPAPTPVATTAPIQQSTGQQVTAWVQNGGQSGLAAIVVALEAMTSDGKAGKFSAVAQDCSQLSIAIANIRAVGPIPDRRAERPFAKALVLYSEAAVQCQTGAATVDMIRGDVYLTRTARVIKALDGS
jgi:hypothetical protein